MICAGCEKEVDSVCVVIMRLAGMGGEGAQRDICSDCLAGAPSWMEFLCMECDGWHGPLLVHCPLQPTYFKAENLSPMEPL